MKQIKKNQSYSRLAIVISTVITTILLISFDCFAYEEITFTYNGLSYTTIDETSVETKMGEVNVAGNPVSGDIEIPDKVYYGDMTFIVKRIGSCSFECCENLTSIKIPETITSIGSRAFLRCNSLMEITLPESLTEIGNAAFSYTSLKEISVPGSVKYIYTGAFNHIESLEFANLQTSSIENLDDLTFSECVNLKQVELPETLISMGSRVFENCKNLESIDIPNGVGILGSEIFHGCEKIESINLPNSIYSIGYNAFDNCIKLERINIPKSLWKIEDNTFCYCISLKEISIPENVKEIDSGAFSYCCNLTNIELPPYLETISDGVFLGCSSLNNIAIPDSVSTIGALAFAECSSLSSVNVPDKVQLIDVGAFDSCISLKEIQLPQFINSIEIGAFSNCSSLIQIELPENLEIINSRLFYNCSSLLDIVIPLSVEHIYDYAFSGCSSLNHIEIPNSVLDIANEAFSNCENLNSFKINEGLKRISLSSDILYGTPLNILYLGREFLSDGNPFDIKLHGGNASPISEITLGNILTEIPEEAFANFHNLKTINLGSSITTINPYAFAWSSIENLVLPPNLTNIGTAAFWTGRNCPSSIAMGCKINHIDKDAFGGYEEYNGVYITSELPPQADDYAFGNYNSTLYVSNESLIDEYQSNKPCWFKFTDFKSMVSPEKIELEHDFENLMMSSGDKFKLNAKLIPDDVSLPYIFWHSSNPEIATVDYDGLVTYYSTQNQDFENTEPECVIIGETLYSNGPIIEIPINSSGNSVQGLFDQNDTNKSKYSNDVYNTQGIIIKRHATSEDINSLPSGLYIISGKKVIIKK